MQHGKIRTLISDRGFGFVRDADGKDYFFHASGLQDGVFATLVVGNEVLFDLGEDRQGRPCAVALTVVG